VHVTTSDLEANKPARRAFAGLLVRKQCWALSRRGKITVFLACLAFVFAVVYGSYPFLSPKDPRSREVLVVEGWMPTYVVRQVGDYYRERSYKKVIVARAIYRGRNQYESGEFVAKYIAENLVDLGIPKDRVQIVFFEPSTRDRTYQSALAVKNSLQQQGGQKIETMDLITLGPHARRSRLLFQRVFADDIQVGVFPVDDQAYDSSRWWRSSAGIREVPFELLAYFYAKFIFRP